MRPVLHLRKMVYLILSLQFSKLLNLLINFLKHSYQPSRTLPNNVHPSCFSPSESRSALQAAPKICVSFRCHPIVGLIIFTAKFRKPIFEFFPEFHRLLFAHLNREAPAIQELLGQSADLTPKVCSILVLLKWLLLENGTFQPLLQQPFLTPLLHPSTIPHPNQPACQHCQTPLLAVFH